MTILFLMGEAAKPSNWYWLWRQQDTAKTLPSANQVDTRIQAVQQPSELQLENSFLSRPVVATVYDTLDTVTLGHAPNVDFTKLAAVKDDTVFRSDEAAAWFHLFDLLSRTKPDKSDRSQAVTFLQLYRQSDFYRGKLVSLSGTARRAHRLHAPANAIDLPGYWQLWLFLDGVDNPVIVYALELPAEFPKGMEISERVRVTGYFFKRLAYNATGGTMLAPLILANQPSWSGPTITLPTTSPQLPRMAILVIVAGLAAGLFAWVVFRLGARPTVRDFQADFRQGSDFTGTGKDSRSK